MLGAALLLAACAAPQPADLGARLAAANLLAGSLAAGLDQALARGDMRAGLAPGGDGAIALIVTLDAVERTLDGAGTAYRARLPQLAEANLAAAERQMAELRPLLAPVDGGQ
jgi:hypothetical protein